MNSFRMDALLEALHAGADGKYRIFNEKLTPGTEGRSIGVRMPALRKIAREILKGDPEAFLCASQGSGVHEINLLHAIVLCAMPCDFSRRLEYLADFVPTIGNWAVCDLLANELRIDPAHLPGFRAFLTRWLESGREFELRFGLILLMRHYSSDQWIDDTLRVYAIFRHEGYYARMGAAWGLSELFVSQRGRVIDFLKTDRLDAFTHNTAIRKITESFRVSDEDKALVRTYRKPAARRDGRS